jgi:hypothetical protein
LDCDEDLLLLYLCFVAWFENQLYLYRNFSKSYSMMIIYIQCWIIKHYQKNDLLNHATKHLWSSLPLAIILWCASYVIESDFKYIFTVPCQSVSIIHYPLTWTFLCSRLICAWVSWRVLNFNLHTLQISRLILSLFV